MSEPTQQIPEPTGDVDAATNGTVPPRRIPTSTLLMVALLSVVCAVSLIVMEISRQAAPINTEPMRTVQDVVEDLGSDDADTRRKAAVEAKYLTDPKPALPALARNMADRDAGLRSVMAESIAALAPHASIIHEDLAGLLSRRERDVQVDARELLIRLGPEARSAGCRKALVLLRSKDTDERRVGSVHLVLLAADDPVVLRELIAALRDENTDIRQLAGYVIGNTKWTPRVAPVFAQSLPLFDPAYRAHAALFVRRAAVQAKESIAALREVQRDAKGSVAELAGFLADGLDAHFVQNCDKPQPPTRPILFIPAFQWEGAGKTAAGTGFIAVAPDGRLVAVTSIHLVQSIAKRLQEAQFEDARTGKARTKFTRSWGKPGTPVAAGTELDLREDALLMLVDDETLKEAALSLDPRPWPEKDEPIWLPVRDAKQPNGFKLVAGKVEECAAAHVVVLLDQAVKLDNLVGSPVISQWTGRVIGMASRGSERDGRTRLYLTPAGSIVDTLLRETTDPLLTQEIGKK